MNALDKFVNLGFSVGTPDNKIIDCRESIRLLLAERDALAARIQAAEQVEKLFGDAPELTFDDCKRLFSVEIAEIKAEAGRAGYADGYEAGYQAGRVGASNRGRGEAEEYAAKVRQGGE